MTEREPKEIIQALINEYKTYKKASFLIIPILAIAAAANLLQSGSFPRPVGQRAAFTKFFTLRKNKKSYLCVRQQRKILLLTTAKKLHSDAPLPQSRR